MLTRTDMYPYQEGGVAFLKPRKNCAAWIFMGGGKCVTTATAFADLQESFDARKMLVVAPKRVARTVWSAEVKSWNHLQHLRVSRIVGDADSCFDALKADADIYTIGRERVPWLHAQFIQGGKQVVEWLWDTVVLDEAQSFKSQSSQRFKCLADLRMKTRFPRMIQLTGTPAPNSYEDLWSQMWLLDRGRRLGVSQRAFRDRWFTPPSGMFQQWKLKEHAPKEIHERIKDIVYCLQESDYLDLPPVIDNFIECELSPAALQTYKRFEREFIAEVAGKTLTAVNGGVLDGKLLQLANGACYTGEKREWVPFHDAKLEALEETLESIGGKALICVNFKHDSARVASLLATLAKQENKTWRHLDSDRDFDDWASGRVDWGVLHPASAGHGLNDVYRAGADDMVWFGLTNNLEWYQQARARLTGGHRRTGRNIRIHHIVAQGTRDDAYVQLIKSKTLTQERLMASLATKVRS